jgi:hypothetical protein
MAINGSRSTFPTTLDSWGAAFTNNSCEIVDAGFFNRMQDALFQLEVYTRRTIQTGKNGVLTPPTSGEGRPHIMFKSFTVSATGAASITKDLVIPGSMFTTAEKNLFGGTPLASGNVIHVQVRRTVGDAFPARAFIGGILSIPALDGSSGMTVRITRVTHDPTATVDATSYTVSLMISNN